MAWNKKKMSPEEEKMLARGLGSYYSHRGQHDLAMEHFNYCVELYQKDKNARVFYRRGLSKLAMAQPKNALEDVLEASRLKPKNPNKAMAVVLALCELNQFENSLIKVNENRQRFKGKAKKSFDLALDVLHGIFDDSVGDAYLPFIYRNKHAFLQAWQKNGIAEQAGDTHLWKMRNEKKNCDVLSVAEKEELLLCPREIARRVRAFRVLSQTYLQKSWIDSEVLNGLYNHENIMMKQFKMTSPTLQKLLKQTNKDLKCYMDMLHARSPLYNIVFWKYPKPGQNTVSREIRLNRVQYQTLRNMHYTLQTIKKYKAAGKIEKLTTFIESIMGEYFVVKTMRVMPWAFEFTNEVYNHLALAYLKYYKIPNNLINIPVKRRLLVLLNLPEKQRIKRQVTKFGDKSAYKEQDIAEINQKAYKKYVAHMEKRLTFSKYGIEKAYICHQIANKHLKFNHYDKCCSMALRGAKESKCCKSNIWEWLNLLLICKGQIQLQKIEILKETLNEAYKVAQNLKNINLCFYIECCQILNGEDLAAKNTKALSKASSRSKQNTSSLLSVVESSNEKVSQ